MQIISKYSWYVLYHDDMSPQRVTIRAIVLLLLLCGTLVVWVPAVPAAADGGVYLTVSFLDVGQGDAIHVTTPDGYELLVDGGPSAQVLRELAADRPFFDKSIDVVIATHPDTDHVAGLVDVLERYEVATIIETAARSESPAAVAFAQSVQSEGARLINAQAGQTMQLGASTTVRILSPRGDATNWETNTASVVVQIVYDDIEFILTGDAPRSIEDYLVNEYGDSLASEVLKLGHHGSDTSSGAAFLQAVRPAYAVVSAGKDNRYGHPRNEVLTRASQAGAQIVSTIDNGTITFQSDGKTVWLK